MNNPKKLKSLYLKYYQQHANAGDQFSFALAQQYFANKIIPCQRVTLTVPNLILVGSYLIAADAHSHICGAGFISAESSLSRLQTAPRFIHCVRGPLTAELLEKQGIPCPKVYADPGILAPELFPRIVVTKHKIGIIPHFLDANLPWISSCRIKGIPIIDVLSPLDEFFSVMNECEVILSSSLHGIIFAHAYGIPALWIELSSNVIGNGFKFYDYYLSVSIKQDKVNRVRVFAETDPYAILKMASLADQSTLITPLKESMSEALRGLRHDQLSTTIRNVMLPLCKHNRTRFVDYFDKNVKPHFRFKRIKNVGK